MRISLLTQAMKLRYISSMTDSFDIGDFDPTPLSAAPDFSYLESLNEEQRTAVEAVDGPVLVLAGAGTGKTRVLITRLAHILNVRAVNPWEILAVTFTNKAAAEMQQRTADLVGPKAQEIKLGTFHSIGVWLLRRHGDLVGLKSNFTILDTDDQLRLLKQILLDAGIDVKNGRRADWPGLLIDGKTRAFGPISSAPGTVQVLQMAAPVNSMGRINHVCWP